MAFGGLEVGNTVGDRIFFEALFNHLLATKLEAAGYGIRRTESHFEFASVSREFSQARNRATVARRRPRQREWLGPAKMTLGD